MRACDAPRLPARGPGHLRDLPAPGGACMSFTIVVACPLHPGYAGKIAPATRCRACALVFATRNETHKVISTPREERTELRELIIAAVE